MYAVFSFFIHLSVTNVGHILEPGKFPPALSRHLLNFPMRLELNLICLFQKIGYDKAAAVAKTAHKEGTTLKVMMPCYSYFSLILFVWMNLFLLNDF